LGAGGELLGRGKPTLRLTMRATSSQSRQPDPAQADEQLRAVADFRVNGAEAEFTKLSMMRLTSPDLS
jgi:hypothetical protein